ncbi:hypothetical protein Q8F55_000988 [Vanrija albida]|uniref:Uncharacterized protein n=1 Tax=Vanrija albida TaxID=181172 RepID=A0ABR3QET8_9TREE
MALEPAPAGAEPLPLPGKPQPPPVATVPLARDEHDSPMRGYDSRLSASTPSFGHFSNSSRRRLVDEQKLALRTISENRVQNNFAAPGPRSHRSRQSDGASASSSPRLSGPASASCLSLEVDREDRENDRPLRANPRAHLRAHRRANLRAEALASQMSLNTSSLTLSASVPKENKQPRALRWIQSALLKPFGKKLAPK